ncbi:MAG: tol-pal system YbgF family protein, partial [Bacteroidia bacterium]
MENKSHKIFAHGKCISEDVLIAYANNTLNAKEKHAVEKHTLGCNMCADALEGIMMMKNPSQLKGIVESLNKKISGAGEERKPIVLWMDTRVRVAVAAGLALLIGFFFLFNNSLNNSADNKTVSDNIKQKGEATDTTKVSFEESAKTDSTANLHQTVSKRKEDDSKSDLQRLIKDGENANNGSGGPGLTNTAHASDGDKLKNITTAQNEFKKDEAAPAPPKDAQQNQSLYGYNDVTTLDRSKSADQDKKAPLQDGKVADKDAETREGADDNFVTGKSTTVTTGTVNEPVKTTVNSEKTANYYSGDSKEDSPKKEEKEKVVKNDKGTKQRKKTPAYPETQKQPDEKSNKGGKDNLENTSAPQSTTIVSGGASGNVSPNSVPQNKKTEQEVTLSKNKQVSDEYDLNSRNDTTMKYRTQMDSISSLGGISSGEKKYDSKDYSGAVLIFSKTLETKPADREALYKLGDSYLQLNKPELAIVQFDKLELSYPVVSQA